MKRTGMALAWCAVTIFARTSGEQTPAAIAERPAVTADTAKSTDAATLDQPTTLKTHTTALPAPLPTSLTQDIDAAAVSSAIIAHLNEVIRYYRMTVVPIQKTGETSDTLYAEQSQHAATQAAQLAFQATRDEAALLARMPGKQPSEAAPALNGEAQKLAAAQLRIAHKIQDLQAQDEALIQQIASAKPAALAALQQQQSVVQGQLALSKATAEAMAKVTGVSQTNSGLLAQIDQLQHAVPELIDSKIQPVASTLQNLASLRDSGVTTQAVTLFQLLGTEHAIDQRIQETLVLHQQALDLRQPLIKILRATIQAGEQVQTAPPIAPTAPATGKAPSKRAAALLASEAAHTELEATRKTYDQLIDAFKAVSGVSIPISQELLLLEQSRSNLLSWRAAVAAERSTIIHELLLRVFSIAAALAFILALGELWRRATLRYVQDLRRRRQLLLVRRMVLGFLGGLVLIFGFVTQFSSLATFAGFITAGIAVGLQTILLSVAAYFFIVGRYGVRVGDRITVANVTGDVVEVGLVRFYMMELAGTGSELHPTGRIAVFANSVLFQTGTPIYKQVPGTDYAWHELTVKLKPATDYGKATDTIRALVADVYEGYRAQIDQQHAQVEVMMGAPIPAPGIEARLQLLDGLQYAVLYPVPIGEAGKIDEEIVHRIVEAMAANATLPQAIDGSPVVRAVIKGS